MYLRFTRSNEHTIFLVPSNPPLRSSSGVAYSFLLPQKSAIVILLQQVDHSVFLLRNAQSIRSRAREDRADRYHSWRGTKRDRGSVCTAAKDRVKVMK